jgi:hypothetical protein
MVTRSGMLNCWEATGEGLFGYGDSGDTGAKGH